MKKKTMAVFECHCGEIYKTEAEANKCHSPHDGTKDYWMGMAESFDDSDSFDNYAEAVSLQEMY